jgi:hypothetical protein
MYQPGDRDSAPSNEKQDWTNSYQAVQVDVKDLADYYHQMLSLAPDATMYTVESLSQMDLSIHMGLVNQAQSQGQVFGEGVVVAEIMMNNHSKFSDFFKDVTAGVTCIANAAGVIAECYNNSDNANGASINDVMFAFDDPGATRPDGLPKGAPTTSYVDAQLKAAENGPQQPMAMTGADPVKTIYLPMGDTEYIYSDGSMMSVKTRTDSNSWASNTTTTTTIMYKGQVVSQTTQVDSTMRGGYKSRTTTVSPTEDPNAKGSSSTNILTDQHGNQTITTTTVGPDGKPTTTDPVHVAASSDGSGNANDQGPIQTAEQQYHTMGDKDYVQQHGSGY